METSQTIQIKIAAKVGARSNRASTNRSRRIGEECSIPENFGKGHGMMSIE